MIFDLPKGVIEFIHNEARDMEEVPALYANDKGCSSSTPVSLFLKEYVDTDEKIKDLLLWTMVVQARFVNCSPKKLFEISRSRMENPSSIKRAIFSFVEIRERNMMTPEEELLEECPITLERYIGADRLRRIREIQY